MHDGCVYLALKNIRNCETVGCQRRESSVGIRSQSQAQSVDVGKMMLGACRAVIFGDEAGVIATKGLCDDKVRISTVVGLM